MQHAHGTDPTLQRRLLDSADTNVGIVVQEVPAQADVAPTLLVDLDTYICEDQLQDFSAQVYRTQSLMLQK